MRVVKIEPKIFACVAIAFASLLGGCTDDGLSATATTERFDQYFQITRPHAIRVPEVNDEVDNAIADMLIELKRHELLSDQNIPSGTQLPSVRRDGGEPRAVDSMTAEEIAKPMTDPAQVFIPEALRAALDDSMNKLTLATSTVDEVIAAWMTIEPPPELSELHHRRLVYYQSLRQYYTASIQENQDLVDTAEISPISQRRVDLAVGQLSDSNAAVLAEHNRVLSVYNLFR